MVVTKRLQFSTQGDGEVVDITEDITRNIGSSGVSDGIVTVFVTATTACVTIMEREPGLVEDLKVTMQRLIPREATYRHNVLNNDTNGHSHTQATLIGASLVVPVIEGRVYLGMWQKIVLVDFDSRPRSREIVLQIMGEPEA